MLCPTRTLPQQVWGCKFQGQSAGDTLGCPVVQSGHSHRQQVSQRGWEQV